MGTDDRQSGTDRSGIDRSGIGRSGIGVDGEPRGICIGAVANSLRGAGLRPTRQRIALARLLFGRGDRHVCAETLYGEARGAGVPVSLATVYNTLHQFTEAGLLRSIAVDADRTWFDTNTGDHQHFYDPATNRVLDMPGGAIALGRLPEPPEGFAIDRVDVIVHLRALD